MSSETKYTLTITLKQAQVMQDALEAYARMKMGQINSVITDSFLDRYASQDYPDFNWDNVNRLCGELKRVIFPELLHPNSYYGVGAKNYPQRDIAWDLHSVIRHRLAWDRLAEEGKLKPDFHGVQYYEPMNHGTEKLAVITKAAE